MAQVALQKFRDKLKLVDYDQILLDFKKNATRLWS